MRGGYLLPIVLLPSDPGGREERWRLHGPCGSLWRRLRHLPSSERVQGCPVGRQEQRLFCSTALCGSGKKSYAENAKKKHS